MREAARTPCVVLEGLGKRYGRQPAIEAVDLTLAPGECVALVGHNGAGKSTLIKLMLGLIRPTEGHARVLDADPNSPAGATARRRIGYLPEHLSLHPALTGAETLAFYARLKGLSPRKNAALLEEVGIAEAADRRVGTYSKGMRQRLGLAQALLGTPALLLLDEPTTGLDPALRLAFYAIMRALRDNGAAVLISSHALAELQDQVDRVIIMNRGRKVADGTIADLRRLAECPVRIRLTLADGAEQSALPDLPPGIGSAAPWRRLSNGEIETSCAMADKMALIEHLAASAGRFRDIEILSPSLDETYAHFLQREVTP